MSEQEKSRQPTEPDGPTGRLCSWIETVQLRDIPEELRTRAKYLILDGIACALVSAHLPWSEKAVNAVLSLESAGISTVFGWDKKISPLSAALLNGTFVQGFELDDWHSKAPLHSNSIILPALFAAAEYMRKDSSQPPVSGPAFLLATLVGYEVGPRIGLALYGSEMLSRGWHSGAVFGPSASASACAKLFGLPASAVEDALGSACTQAGGLMSAQFESEVKRMQHGFAARNGLLAATLAKGGYIGIKRVYEREYGGYLAAFGQGSGRSPPYAVNEICKDLGSQWQTDNICVKPYSSMAATHATIDCIRQLQKEHKNQMSRWQEIEKITIQLSKPAFHHGGFKIERPLTSTGAQMSARYVAATQIIDGEVLPPQFRSDKLERHDLWALVEKIETEMQEDWPDFATQVEIRFKSETISNYQRSQRGVDPALTNEEIVEKWRSLVKTVIDEQRMNAIEEMVIGLEDVDDIAKLSNLLASTTKNPIA